MKAILSVFFLIAVAIRLHAQDSKTIDIIERCNISITPDLLNVDYTVFTVEKKESDAIAKLGSQIDTKLKELVGLGFVKDDLKIGEFSINEERDLSSEKRKSLGFKAEQVIEIRIPIARKSIIGNLIESISSSPDIKVYVTVTTGLSPELQKKTREAMLISALKNATDRANLIASSLGVELSDVKTVHYNPDGKHGREVFSSQSVGYLHSDAAFRETWTMHSVAEEEISESIHVVWNIATKSR
jgi:uncharacterized protein YggE